MATTAAATTTTTPSSPPASSLPSPPCPSSRPVFARSALSFSGHLVELECALLGGGGRGGGGGGGGGADHSGPLVSDCSSAICLRNRSVEALATAALVQAIREAQERGLCSTSKTLERYLRCCYNSQDSSASDRETQVFHMDRNDYYGGESCSLNLFQLCKRFRGNDTPLHIWDRAEITM
uniref:Uncharacterized protein n=1 Tax=Ananas comosus var. bracteatus TaxID=296719 RepID=A0A6V7NT32_ANACO|nr:unnamed protein product [Ananas comosus var. bracteatus]